MGLAALGGPDHDWSNFVRPGVGASARRITDGGVRVPCVPDTSAHAFLVPEIGGAAGRDKPS